MLQWLCVMMALMVAACGGPSNLSDAKPLRVGMDLSYPPFETIDEAGKPMGVSVDLAEAFGAYLGRPVVVENIPFVGLIPSLKTGQIDCVISSMTVTPERAESVAFSNAYLQTGLAMLVGAEAGVQDVRDLDQEGRTVVVRQGTTGEVWARRELENAKILAVEKENAAVLEVLQGNADAFIYDQMSVWSNWQQHTDRSVARLRPLQVEEWAIAVRLEEEDLQEAANQFLQKFRQEGGFQRLGDKFLFQQKEAFEEQGIPFVF